MTWEIFFSYVNIWVYFSRVKIWQVTSVLVPSYIPVCIHETQHSDSVACLSGQTPDISTIENTFFFSLKMQGMGEIWQIIFRWGHFWLFFFVFFEWVVFAALRLLNTTRSPVEAWEPVLERCWQPPARSSPVLGTGHGVIWPGHGGSFLMAAPQRLTLNFLD